MGATFDGSRGRCPEVCRVREWSGDPVEIAGKVASYLSQGWSRRGRELVAAWRNTAADQPVHLRAQAVASILARWWPPLLDEMGALAVTLDVDPAHVLASWAPRATQGSGRSCTVFWVPGERAAGGRPLVGRNFDLRLAYPERLFVYTRPVQGHSHAGSAGWCGRSEGINDAGLVVAPAEAQVRRDAHPGLAGGQTTGHAGEPPTASDASLPARLATRILLERCATVAEAVEVLLSLPQWTQFNYLLADAAGDAAVVEVGTSQRAVRRPGWDGREWLIATNHFCSPELMYEADFRWLTRQKYQRAQEELDAAGRTGPGTLTAADCSRVLAAPGVVQRHLTLWSEVFECGGDGLYLSPGRPDRNEYVRLPAPGTGISSSKLLADQLTDEGELVLPVQTH